MCSDSFKSYNTGAEGTAITSTQQMEKLKQVSHFTQLGSGEVRI